jgi:AraC-like DNA-binding protein
MPDFSIDPDEGLALLAAPGGPLVIAVAGTQDGERMSPPHQHPRGQLLGSTRGLLSVHVDDGVWLVPPIHAVWLPPHHVHAVRSHGPFQGWSTYIDEAACAALPQRPCTMRPSALLREAVLRAATWPTGELDAANARVAAVIVDEIGRLPVAPFGLPLPRDARLLRIAHALIADPADTRGLEEWAAWAGLSSRTLSRRFVAETRFSFTTWRQRARLMRALEMLAASVPVSTIALDLGYATASAFIALFRRSFGATPALYRQRF